MSKWVISSYCDSTACIEVNGDGDLFALRNSASRDATMQVTRAEIDAFVKAWLDGEFDAQA